MTCKACESQPSGSVNRQCMDCRVRLIAEGPWFFQSLCAGYLLGNYLAELRSVFGAKCDIEEAHRRVKAVAKKHQRGSLPA